VGVSSGRISIDGPYNIRLHLTAPPERYDMQATPNRLVVPKNRPRGMATIDYTAGQRRGSRHRTCRPRGLPRPERTRGAAGEPDR